MPAETNSIDAEIHATSARAKKAAHAAVDETGQRTLNEAIDAAERGIREAAKRVEKAMREGVDTLRTQAGPYRDQASHQFDEAHQYLVERVKERPITATLAGLGVGLL